MTALSDARAKLTISHAVTDHAGRGSCGGSGAAHALGFPSSAEARGVETDGGSCGAEHGVDVDGLANEEGACDSGDGQDGIEWSFAGHGIGSGGSSPLLGVQDAVSRADGGRSAEEECAVPDFLAFLLDAFELGFGANETIGDMFHG